MWKIPSFSRFERCLISSLLLMSKKCASHFCRETANENKQFKETKTWPHLIHTWSDKAFRFCKSGILIFTWRATWNYAYSPFNFYLILYANLVLKIISAYWNSVEFYTNFLHCKIKVLRIFFPKNGFMVHISGF